MSKKRKKIIIALCIIGGTVTVLAAALILLGSKINKTLDKQINTEIDMSKAEDGVYQGSSDGFLVKVEVEVTVEDHQIKDIKLIKHQNGQGKPAEAMILDMIAKNTDNVDVVSGATVSGKTIRNAVNNALNKALK